MATGRHDRPGTPSGSPHVAAAAAVVAGLLLLMVSAGVGSRSSATDAPELTVTVVEARTALNAFTRLLDAGRVEEAFAMAGDALRGRPEAIDGFAVNPLLDFHQEYRYMQWTAALGGQRVISSCAASRWRHLRDGVPVVEDAQLLSCAGTFTNEFYAAAGLAPAPTDVTVAVGPGSQILLYKERVRGVDHTRAFLEFRRWLRARHPERVGIVFTPGGTPVTTAESARLMLELVANFASGESAYSSMAVSGQP